MTNDKHPICQRIDNIRVGLGLSITELAALAEMPVSTAYHVLAGKTVSPRFSTVERLVIALDQGELTIVEQRQRIRHERFTTRKGDMIIENPRNGRRR